MPVLGLIMLTTLRDDKIYEANNELEDYYHVVFNHILDMFVNTCCLHASGFV